MKNNQFFLTPNKIFDEGLKPREFIVYSYLLRCGDAKDNRFLQEKTLRINVAYQFQQLTLHLKILKTTDLFLLLTETILQTEIIYHTYTLLKKLGKDLIKTLTKRIQKAVSK